MAHKFAFERDNITAEAVSAVVALELAREYRVLGTPHTVINGEAHLKGRLHEARLLAAVQGV